MRVAPSSLLPSMPRSRFNGPDSELLAANTSVPGPLLVNPPLPASETESVAVFCATTMDAGAASVSATPLLPTSAQFWLPMRSPKRSVLMVRGESSVTVRSAVMSNRLKSAVLPAPSAMTPLAQLELSPHNPSPSVIHAPLGRLLVCGTAVVNKPTIEHAYDV